MLKAQTGKKVHKISFSVLEELESQTETDPEDWMLRQHKKLDTKHLLPANTNSIQILVNTNWRTVVSQLF